MFPAGLGWNEAIEDQSKILPPPKEGQAMGITVAVCLQYALSRGTVHIKSSDVTEHPAIEMNFLSHPADSAMLAAGLKVRMAWSIRPQAVG